MDSPGSSISSLSASEATQLLKDILNVGKPRSSASDTSANSLPGASETIDSKSTANGDHPPSEGSESLQMSAQSDHFVLADLLSTMNKQQAITKQQIILRGDDSANSFSVYGRDVDIVSSPAAAITQQGAASNNQNVPGSNKVKINPVVNFDWEHRYYAGNLVAVHRNAIHIAYVLKGKGSGIVRLINRKTAERALVKGFQGRVTDISFAHTIPVILGAVDEIGNMFINEILESPEGKIEVISLLHVTRPDGTPPSDNHRLIWCPYIPDEEDSSGTVNTTADSSTMDDIGKLLVLTHDEVAEMWNIDMVTKELGSGPLLPSEVDTGFLTIESHSKPILDASFSPDGTALATASSDGEVKFFQVYLQDKSPPRCLHQWQPHDGKPVTSLFFLDDHKHPNPEVQFWKFALTGADMNREIKVWSCESWTCLQTLRFMSPPPMMPSHALNEPCIKAAMDLSANYLILSDIRRRVLYILQVYQDSSSSRAHVSSISEFLLTQPCLSFAILDACRRKFKKVTENNDIADVTTGEIAEEEDEEVPREMDGPDIGVLAKMYSVHTKALQELQIRFRPESSTPQPPAVSMSTMSQDGLRDGLSDMSMETTASDFDALQTNRSNMSLHSERSAPSEHSLHTTESVPQGEHSHNSDISLPSDRSLPSERSAPSERSRQSDLSYESSHSKEATDAKPVLLTPDAFTSPRKVETSTPAGPVHDSIRSSGSSSFTQVTAMDDDLRTPHASIAAQSQPSPSSSLTITPSSSREFSGSQVDTPTSVPLPPATPSEEQALKTPTSATRILDFPLSPSHTPRQTEFASPVHSARTAGFPVAPTLTSSPALSKSNKDPVPSEDLPKSDIQLSSGETVEDFFGGAANRRGTLQSTGSSSSTSLEVSEILEGARRPGQEMMYEETTEEEEELGKDAEEMGKAGSIVVDSVDSGQEVPQQPQYDPRIWPKPPDVPELMDVNMEAQRLATEAIERAAHLQQQRAVEQEEEEIEEVIDEQEEDDVQIEEEKEEEIEDEEEEVAATPVQPVATSSQQGDYSRDVLEQFSMSLDTISLQGQGDGDIVDRNVSQERHVPTANPIDLNSVKELAGNMEQMLVLLRTQHQEMQVLRQELSDQRHTVDVIDNLQAQMDNLQVALESKVTGALSQHSVTETQRLHKVLSEKDLADKQKHERLLSTMSQTMDRTISSQLEKTIREEIRNAVLPSVAKVIEPIKVQLHTEMAHKLTATDALMKENIAKLVRSRQTVESIGQAAGNSVQGHLQAVVRDMVLPGFDKISQNTFHQMNDAFHKGTQEYVQSLESHLESVRRRHDEARDPVVAQMVGITESLRKRERAQEQLQPDIQNLSKGLKSTVDQIFTSQTDLENKISQQIAGMEGRIVTELRKIVQEEVSRTMQEQERTISDSVINAMRSGAVTPAPITPDPHRQIDVLGLLRQGQVNLAFQQALSAADLSLVMTVCDAVNPAEIFNQCPCPLNQPVILSLIQQLSADLVGQTQLKNKYLQEAVMALDSTHPVTREHMPAILGGLVQKLNAYIQTYPQDSKDLRMLLMASQSLLR